MSQSLLLDPKHGSTGLKSPDPPHPDSLSSIAYPAAVSYFIHRLPRDRLTGYRYLKRHNQQDRQAVDADKRAAPACVCASRVQAALPTQPLRCAFRPPRPLLLWDGQCGFCARWARRIKSLAGDRIECAPYQQRLNDFPEIAAEYFASAVFLILPDGRACHSAEAIYRALALRRPLGILLLLYQKCSPFARLSEHCYRKIARSFGS